MIFLGNKKSAHLKTWIKIYEQLNINIDKLYTVHAVKEESDSIVCLYYLNKILSYFILGLYMRFLCQYISTIHAHGASGYGLSALISGKKYIVTIYGSEVLKQHSFVYMFIVKLVLLKATKITVTAIETKDIIVSRFAIDERKICCFHTGIDTEELDTFNAKSNPNEIWKGEGVRYVSFRNTSKNYNTQLIISEFLKCNKLLPCGSQLVVIQGNGDRKYYNNLKAEYSNMGVVFIDGLLERPEMLSIISSSDVCINFPDTDQLSSSILEAIYYNKVLVSCSLGAYKELFSNLELSGYTRLVTSFQSLSSGILEASNLVEIDSGREIIRGNYSIESAANRFNEHITDI